MYPPKLLAGGAPASESRETTNALLRALLRLEITCFIDLRPKQERILQYRKQLQTQADLLGIREVHVYDFESFDYELHRVLCLIDDMLGKQVGIYLQYMMIMSLSQVFTAAPMARKRLVLWLHAG